MKQEVKASLTVEASLLFPFLFLLSFTASVAIAHKWRWWRMIKVTTPHWQSISNAGLKMNE